MHRYQIVARTIRDWIDRGVMKPGDRAPSVRDMSSRSGFSQITVRHAYALLESEAVLTARARSGYYITNNRRMLAELPDPADDQVMDVRDGAEGDLIRLRQVLGSWENLDRESFASRYPSRDLMPNRDLYGCLLRALRQEAHRGVPCQDQIPLLREIIAKRAGLRGIMAKPDDITLVDSPRVAFDLCLDVVTRPGDAVLVESPTDLCLFSSLQKRDLRIVEVYSNPRTGLDPEQFSYLLENNDIRACLLTPVHHCPTGTICSEETMRRIVGKASERGVHIIENDLYGELSFGLGFPRPLKAFDPGETVLQVGSFATTLGARFGLGWVLHRRYRDALREETLLRNLTTERSATSNAVAQYMQGASYDRHLRRLREKLETRMQQGLALMSRRFPQNCSASRPRGGFMCWVRGSSRFDSMEAADQASRLGIRLAPGQLFSVTRAHKNFVALNLSFAWDRDWEEKLGVVASLLAARS